MARTRVQDVACEIILSRQPLSAKEMADLVRRRLPGCNCGAASIAWCKSKLKQREISFTAADICAATSGKPQPLLQQGKTDFRLRSPTTRRRAWS